MVFENGYTVAGCGIIAGFRCFVGQGFEKRASPDSAEPGSCPGYRSDCLSVRHRSNRTPGKKRENHTEKTKCLANLVKLPNPNAKVVVFVVAVADVIVAAVVLVSLLFVPLLFLLSL